MSLSCTGRVRREWSRHGNGGTARTKGPRQERASIPPTPCPCCPVKVGKGKMGEEGGDGSVCTVWSG